MFAAVLLTAGCTNEGITPDTAQPDLPGQSAWRITWFWDKDKDETSDFASYMFYFLDGGVFRAVNNNNTVNGTWSIITDDGKKRLVLAISPTKPLSELNDDWVIIDFTADLIRLRDDNKEHLEELVFERER